MESTILVPRGTAARCVGLGALQSSDAATSTYAAAFSDATLSIVRSSSHVASGETDGISLVGGSVGHRAVGLTSTGGDVTVLTVARGGGTSCLHTATLSEGGGGQQQLSTPPLRRDILGAGTAVCAVHDGVAVGFDTGDVAVIPHGSSQSAWEARCFGGAGPSVRAVVPWTFSRDRLLAACGSSVHVFERGHGAPVAVLPSLSLTHRGDAPTPLPPPPITALCLDEDDPWAVMGGTEDGRMYVWDMRNASAPVRPAVRLHTGAVRAFALVKLGRREGVEGEPTLVSVGDDGAVRRLSRAGLAATAGGDVTSRVATLLQCGGPLASIHVHCAGRLRLTSPGSCVVVAGGAAGTLESCLLSPE